MALKARTPWQVTKAVWHAMFMRELVARIMADRMAWFWMILEPIAMVVFMLFVRTVILGRTRLIINADFIPWLIVGLFGFFLFRDNMMRSLTVVSMNRALFAFRQVKTVDTVLVRCFVDGSLRTFIFMLFILGALLLDIYVFPDLPIETMFAWLSLWALGLGIGLTLSVLAGLVREVSIIVRILTMPLLLFSGVIIPVTMLPHFLHQYILYNPIVHGLETLRMAFFQNYHTLPGIDLYYLWYWALGSMLLGLILHQHFQMRLKAQ